MSVRSSSDSQDERSPLLIVSERPPQDKSSKASVMETMANMGKLCFGTGCLTLPFAARQGGILIYFFGTFVISLWNSWVAIRLSSCWDLVNPPTIDEDEEKPEKQNKPFGVSTLEPPPAGASTFGKVAWYALGPFGLVLSDTMMILLLTGALVAYNDVIRSFLQATLVTTGRDDLDAMIIALVVAPLSIVPDLGYLTKLSAAGLGVMAFAFLVVAGFGLFGVSDENPDDLGASVQWDPRNGMAGVSQWFGCVVFAIGTVPLTFNLRDSMAEPSQFPKTICYAQAMTAVGYLILGLGFFMLFPNIESDIFSVLPEHGVLPTVTRLAMAVVVVSSAPLMIVPCGEIIEGKLLGDSAALADPTATRRLQVIVRFGICFSTVAVSVGFPKFVGVLALVGCACVGSISFIIPPGFHLALTYQKLCYDNEFNDWQDGRTCSSFEAFLRTVRSGWRLLWVDFLFLLVGMTTTVISTAQVYQQMTLKPRMH